MNIREIIALISVVLYTGLGLLSLCCFVAVQRRLTNPKLILMADDMTKKFNYHSKIFFLVLSISALLDVPIYIGCLVQGGPIDCEWDNVQYSIYLALHFVALCGYFYCLGVPLFLWAEVVATKEMNIKSILMSFDMKLFLFASIFCYCALQLIRMIGLVSTPSTDHHSFQKTELHAVTSCLETLMIVIILTVWLWCGIRLQMHVKEVSFQQDVERRILFIVNIVMALILMSNLVRAIMILSLFLDESFHIHWKYSFFSWVLGTRWIPYIFCSALLLMIMQRSFSTLGQAKLLSQDEEEVNGGFRASQKQFRSSTSATAASALLSAVANSHNNSAHNSSAVTRLLSADHGSSNEDGRASFVSQDSYALYVADYDNHMCQSPPGSFSHHPSSGMMGHGADLLEGPGTPMLASISEEDPEDQPPPRSSYASSSGGTGPYPGPSGSSGYNSRNNSIAANQQQQSHASIDENVSVSSGGGNNSIDTRTSEGATWTSGKIGLGFLSRAAAAAAASASSSSSSSNNNNNNNNGAATANSATAPFYKPPAGGGNNSRQSTPSQLLTQRDTVISTVSLEAFADDDFGGTNTYSGYTSSLLDSQVRAPLLRREMSINSDVSFRTDRKGSI